MRWLKVVALRFHNLEKRELRRDRVRIRRYKEWRGDSYRWMRIVNIMDVWGKRREHVEGQERQEKCEKERERRESNDVGATGTVNVGSGSATVNIGTNAPSALVLGRTGGSVTLGPALTLGAAPPGVTGLTSGSAPYLGSFYNPVISSTIADTNTPQSSISIGTPGVYLFTFVIQLAYTTLPTTFYCTLTGANIANLAAYGFSQINTGNVSSHGSIVINCTASTYNLSVNYAFGSGLSINSQSYFQAVRIG